MVRTARLQKDVDIEEDMEQRRLEAGVLSDDDEEAGDGGALQQMNSGALAEALLEEAAAIDGVLDVGQRDDSTAGALGDVVQGAAQRRKELVSKMFANGGFRKSSKIVGLLPYGGDGLKTKVPRRKDFGAEGDEGDAAHAAAMKQFSLKEFGSTIVQGKSIDKQMRRVGLFGFWLERNG